MHDPESATNESTPRRVTQHKVSDSGTQISEFRSDDGQTRSWDRWTGCSYNDLAGRNGSRLCGDV